MIPYHTLDMVSGGQPVSADHVKMGLYRLTFDTSAKSITSLGAITAGSGFTDVTKISIAATGGTGSGVVVRATALKAVSATVVFGGTSGFVVNDTVTLPNGVVLTVATVSSGVIATVTVSTAGTFGLVSANPVSMASTSGSGVGVPIFSVLYGIASVQLFNSGSYSVVPTGMSITDGLGAGTGASLAAPTLGGTGVAVLAGVAFPEMIAADYGLVGTASGLIPCSKSVQTAFGFALAVTPATGVSVTVAGSVDAILFA